MVSALCIYCLQETADWSTEHVMPRALGTFEPNAPTLLEHVCKACNNAFSKYEGELARESFESWARTLTGVKAPTVRAGDLKNVEARLNDGPAAGAMYSPVTTHDITQVGLKRKDGCGYEFFTLAKFKELEAIDHTQFEVYEQHSVTVVTAGDEAQRDAAYVEVDKAFRRLGLMAGEGRKITSVDKGSPLNLRLHFSIPREILRMYAKLAFNHLAFITSADFVRGSTFDYFRRFIRYGEESGERPLGVMRLKEPDISAAGAPTAMGRHILATGPTNMGSDISGLVVLFDTLLIKFKLCRFFPDPLYPNAVQAGTSHVFDIQKRSVTRVRLTSEFFWLA